MRLARVYYRVSGKKVSFLIELLKIAHRVKGSAKNMILPSSAKML